MKQRSDAEGLLISRKRFVKLKGSCPHHIPFARDNEQPNPDRGLKTAAGLRGRAAQRSFTHPAGDGSPPYVPGNF